MSIEHGITDVQEQSSVIIKWYDIEEREWLPLPILKGIHYSGSLICILALLVAIIYHSYQCIKYGFTYNVSFFNCHGVFFGKFNIMNLQQNW